MCSHGRAELRLAEFGGQTIGTVPGLQTSAQQSVNTFINSVVRTQHRQLVFPPQYEDSPTRLRTFLNQPDICGVAYFVAECLALFP